MSTTLARPDPGRRQVPMIGALVVALVAVVAAGSPVLATPPIWAQLFPVDSPSARSGVAMAYDADTQQTILFGGRTDASTNGLAETWNWDGGDWIRLHPAHHPSRGYGASMAFDRASGQLILIGGAGGASVGNDETWSWTGSDWVKLTPAHHPIFRFNASLAYDVAQHRLILFGGFNAASTLAGYLGDTWAWNGTDWTRLHPHAHPRARYGASLAWDGWGQYLVLFGGNAFGSGGHVSNATWIWTGNNWVQQHPSHVPARRVGAQMAWDTTDRELVMFGGERPNTSSSTHARADTWAWVNGDWASVGGAHPPGRYYGGMASVPSEKGLLLFGGATRTATEAGDNPHSVNGTWVFTVSPPS